MSASIRVESGISAGTSFWIDRPVLRIGSDPQCEICVPSAELAPHALTLEFRTGSYRIYNRDSAIVTVGRAVVQPGGNAIWNADQAVELPGDVRLVLSVDGDPQPSPRPETRADDGFADDRFAATDASGTPGDGAAKKSSSSMVQLGIIGFCILGMAAFLTMDFGGDTAAAERPTFDGIVESLLAKDKDDAARELLPRLQYAQAALVRGNDPLALERFLKLRDQLIRQRESLPEDDRTDAEQMLDYVEFQLSQLQ